ncbi:MAG: TatD family hydrolase [Anaerolineae bacterium]
MRLADTHAHLSDECFDADRQAVLQRARAAGVMLMVDVGADLASSGKAVALASEDEAVWAAVGVHPHEAAGFGEGELAMLRELANCPRVVAIGEIGLDFYRDLSPRQKQRDALEMQLALAGELGKPVLVHCRDAYPQVLESIRHWQGRIRGVLHCFSGTEEALYQALDQGLFISLAGPVTYERAEHTRTIARLVPIERLLLETDCPYLAPAPKRGKRNEPLYLTCILDTIARVRGVPAEDLAEITFENVEGFFGLS